MKYSVCMSVYRKDNPTHFILAINSIINQSSVPAEIILVIDGPIDEELEFAVKNIQLTCHILKVIRLKDNQGHAAARQTAILHASYDLIGLMDSDDISLPDRFEKQLAIFQHDQQLSVLGGQISEFIDTVDNIVGYRKVPLSDYDIKRYLKKRCPFNQMTVMIRKSAILSVGGYQDWFCNEDYYLWVRLALANCKFKNLSYILVNMRVGKEMYRRRGGVKYYKSEAKLQKYMLAHKLINFQQYIFNIIVRFIVQVLLPNWLRGFIFQKCFRKHVI